MPLPVTLSTALNALLIGKSRSELAARAARQSERYRAGGASSDTVLTSDDVLAYAIARMPATYAAVGEVLRRLQQRCPGFSPTSLLDAGCGPGTASWAALAQWPGLGAMTQLDHSAMFLELARQLGADEPVLHKAIQLHGDLQGSAVAPPAELVILGYALAELATAARDDVLQRLWHGCSGALVMVEPGTPDGYRRILQARDWLIAQGAAILAPCPHQAACPLTGTDWCHFSIRLPRRRDHMIAKDAVVPFEDEKFSYLLAVRPELFTPANHSRIIARVMVNKVGITTKLCTPQGKTVTTTAAKRDRDHFAKVKKLDWGDEWPH